MKNKWVLFTVKCCIVVFAALFMGLGISMIYKANIGSDPGGIFIQALSFRTGIAVGLTDILFNASLVVVFAFITPKRINVGTLIQTLFIGMGVDLANKLVCLLPDFSLVGNIILCTLGAVIIGVAIGIYLPCYVGTSPFDIAILFLCDITHRSYRTCCYIVYLIFGVSGILLGGVWGIGSVIAMLVTGAVAGFFIPRFEKLYGRLWGENETESKVESDETSGVKETVQQ